MAEIAFFKWLKWRIDAFCVNKFDSNFLDTQNYK